MNNNIKIAQFLLHTSKRPNLYIGSECFENYILFIHGFLFSQSNHFLGKDYLESRFTELFNKWIESKHNKTKGFIENIHLLCGSFTEFQELILSFCKEELKVEASEIDELGNLKIKS